MAVEFSSFFTKRYYVWSDFKIELSKRVGSLQYDQTSDYYIIWFYDGNDVFITNIWIGSVPSDITSLTGYNQTQNDNDKSDFLSNYVGDTNNSIIKSTVSGVAAQAPAKGLGGFAPDPKNNPYEPNPDEVVSLYADAEGSLVTRGAILTDEGSLRDDFTGTSLYEDLTGTLYFTNGSNIVTGSGTIFTQELNRNHYIKLSSDGEDKWVGIVRVPSDTTLQLEEPYNGTTGSGSGKKTRWLIDYIGTSPGSISLSNSVATISSGTDGYGGLGIYRGGDYLPLVINIASSISQRLNNQVGFLGFRDNIEDPKMYCDIFFDGYDNTTLKFRSAWNSDEELSIIKLPAGLTTDQSLRYKIDLSIDYCALMINGVLVAKHEKHIPDPYVEVYLCAGIYNNGNTTNTDLVIDTILFLNQDQVQIASTFISPIAVITKEDQYTLIGELITDSTAANQEILEYTVPEGKVFYIIGYRIETSGTLSGSIKIGKNNISSNPSSPGNIDDNIFRVLRLNPGDTTGEIDFGSNPRKVGVGGDVIKVAVTPSGALTTTWSAVIDFVLR